MGRLSSPILVLALLGCSEAAVTKFNTPPTADITSHADGDSVIEREDVELRGTVGDPNHPFETLSVTWLVDDTSVCPDAAPDDAGLVTCVHAFTPGGGAVALEVRDPEGGSAVDRVMLTVAPTEPPEVTITAPASDARLYAGQVFPLQGVVSDAEDAPTDLTVSWETDTEGVLDVEVDVTSEGAVESFTSLDEGAHALRLRAVDTLGREGTDSVVIQVGPANSTPECTIDAPVEGTVYTGGTSVALRGTGSDADQAAETLRGTWSSDLDGDLFSGLLSDDGLLEYASDALTLGTHRLSFEVRDELGAVCTAAVEVVVHTLPTAPTVVLSPDPAVTTDALVATASGSVDPDSSTPVTYTYLWTVDGAASSVSTTDVFPATDTVKHSTYTVEVTPVDLWEAGPSTSAQITVQNSPPVFSGITLSPSTVEVGAVLTCAATATDADGDPVSVTYAWHDGSTGPTLTVPEGMGSGDTLTCTATADDGDGGSDTVTVSLGVSNSAPTLSGLSVVPTAPTTDDLLTASVTAADANGDAVSLTWDWSVDGSVVQSGADATLDGALLFDKDDLVTVTVTATDGTDSSTASYGPITVVNTPPDAPGISIAPTTPGAGDELVCTVDVASNDADSDGVSYSMTWTVDGVDYIAGGSADTGLDSGISGFVGPSTTTWPDDTVPGEDVGPGEVWVCEATPDDGDDIGSAATASVTVDDCASVSMDGNGDGILVGTAEDLLGITNAFSISAWVWIPSTATVSTHPIFSAEHTTSSTLSQNSGYAMQVLSGSLALYVGTGLESTDSYPDPNWYTTSAVPTDQWTHLLVTRDGSTVRLYVDGVLDLEDTTANSADISYDGAGYDHTRYAIGRSMPNGLPKVEFGLEGRVAQVGVWSRALSSAEVGVLSATTFDTSLPDLVGYWPLDEGTGTTAVDGSGLGNDGAFEGDATYVSDCP